MPTQNLSVEARLEAHALLDRLTANGPTFVREDALRLIELIPITPSRRLSFSGILTGRGPGLRGRAAGAGDVNLEGAEIEKRASWNAIPSHRIGGYIVAHTPGQISISLLWSETREDQTGQSCLLLYDHDTQEVSEMRISVQKTLTLLFIRLAYVSYVPWKRPEPAQVR
jgi:hypothetical protein